LDILAQRHRKQVIQPGSGVLFDLTGSYQTVLIISAVMAAIAAVSVMLIRQKREVVS